MGVSGKSIQKDRNILISSTLGLLFFALLVLSFSGALPQIAFNLGNRVTYFGSMFLALVVLSLAVGKIKRFLIIFIFSLSVMGLSDHWKNWNEQQTKIIRDISSNQSFDELSVETVFVVGNQYSLLSGYSHIEFFSTNYVINAVFKHALSEFSTLTFQTLNQYNFVEQGVLYDKKSGDKVTIPKKVLIFDSNKMDMISLSSSE